MQQQNHTHNVMLADDSSYDVLLLQAAMMKADVAHLLHLTIANDGVEAMEMIDEHGDELNLECILLDMNMPRKDGKQVLRELRQHEKHSHLPVIILTNTDEPKDYEACYALKADAVVQKPYSYKALVDFCVALRKSIETHGKINPAIVMKHYHPEDPVRV